MHHPHYLSLLISKQRLSDEKGEKAKADPTTGKKLFELHLILSFLTDAESERMASRSSETTFCFQKLPRNRFGSKKDEQIQDRILRAKTSGRIF